MFVNCRKKKHVSSYSFGLLPCKIKHTTLASFWFLNSLDRINFERNHFRFVPGEVRRNTGLTTALHISARAHCCLEPEVLHKDLLAIRTNAWRQVASLQNSHLQVRKGLEKRLCLLETSKRILKKITASAIWCIQSWWCVKVQLPEWCKEHLKMHWYWYSTRFTCPALMVLGARLRNPPVFQWVEPFLLNSLDQRALPFFSIICYQAQHLESKSF